ncbi:condensation domain-containing protein, partial [Pedobacter jeongneungensis]|uniref:condensation domain-containing protein n=1 Tax=Pedobacter jeongneungensis TaxID=947309 RepID=UPI0031ED7921
ARVPHLSIPVVQERPAKVPLSFSQERLWFIDRLQGSTNYHISGVLSLRGPLDISFLERSLGNIVDRHEVLRTVVFEDDGIGYQQVLPGGKWSLGYSSSPEFSGKAYLEEHIGLLIGRPFDLSRDSMLRVDLLEIGPEDYVLVFVMHHIASDGWSMNVLIREFVSLYQGYLSGKETVLPVLPMQYADYSLWQRGQFSGPEMDIHLDYWKNHLKGVVPLDLPT